ncbi:collinsiaVII-like protein [Tanacetum coccineum]
MHSPPRPVTVEDQQEWKITSCVSILKNVKGYIVPLDIQIAAHEGIDAERQGKKRERTTLLALSENACFEGISGTRPTRDMMEQFKRGKIREKRRVIFTILPLECKAKASQDSQRYSAYKTQNARKKTDDSQALISVDTFINWQDHEDAHEGALKIYGMIASMESDPDSERKATSK